MADVETFDEWWGRLAEANPGLAADGGRCELTVCVLRSLAEQAYAAGRARGDADGQARWQMQTEFRDVLE